MEPSAFPSSKRLWFGGRKGEAREARSLGVCGSAFGPPAPRTAFENVGMMDNAVEHGGYRRPIAQEFALVVLGTVRQVWRLDRSCVLKTHPNGLQPANLQQEPVQ